MPKLTDTQSLLLATAAQRESGSLLPLPATITAPAGGIAKSLASLVNKGLLAERETGTAGETHRTKDDTRFGLYVTAAGLAAIGVDDGAPEDGSGVSSSPAPAPIPAPVPAQTPAAPAAAARVTKAGTVLALLQREGGATLAELVEATGWLPHTTRAALTGLRKKGHTVERSKRGDLTCYRIAAAA